MVEKLKFRSLLMETLGVTALCTFGGLSCIMKAENKGSLVTVALCHMFVLAGMIYVGMACGSGQYNPAVTLGLMLTGQFNFGHGLMYMGFQTIGSLIAGLILRYAVPGPGRVAGGLGYPTVADGSQIKALVCEIIGTFSLVFMVFGTIVDKRAAKYVGPMCVGASLGCAVLAFGPISGAALNPLRWLGPNLFGWILCDCDHPDIPQHERGICNKNCGGMGNFWIYLIGPFGGGIVAAFLYRFLFLNDQDQVVDKEKLE